jgi:hypothetical protein
MHRAAEILRPNVHMDEYGLGLSCELREALRGAERRVFVGADDDFRLLFAGCFILRSALYDRRIIRTRIYKHVRHARRNQSVR